MANLAIIPARGGSKRIPRKNIKDFMGKPIIAYSIETAIKSGLFDEVMVSTDDKEIAEVALKYGAKVPFFRSKENADDYATTTAVLQEVLEAYKKLGKTYKSVCCIYPTAALATSADLVEGYKKLISQKPDFVYPVIAFSYPVLRGVYIDNEGNLKMKWPEYLNTRSQDLEQVYHDSGQWYWYNWESLYNNKIEIIKPIIIDEFKAQDIDNESDWMLAELKYQILQNNKSK
jgi:pseudaminic acid cytidylyltransferase